MRAVRSIIAGLSAILIGSTAWGAACDGFTDVDSANTTYCPAVSYLKDHGITLGCTGTTYCPNAYVTRLQMALFLQRMGKGDPSNTLGGTTSTIGGGVNNTVGPQWDVVSGGVSNVASDFGTTVAGGTNNTASGSASTVAGGQHNTASGVFSIVLGGANNVAAGSGSIAAGWTAKAEKDRCAVFSLWVENTDNGMSCFGLAGVFRIAANHGISIDYGTKRFDGGGSKWVTFGDIFSGQTIGTWTGGYLTDAGVWVNGASSKVSKTAFSEVDTHDILNKVARMPITTWRYKQGEGDVRHIGPMAEDFWESFGVGYGPQTIADLDARGVALAAIQGLNAKLESLVAQQARELAEIKAQLAAIVAAR